MKKCTYCGKEYPDDAVRCIIDHEPLCSDEPKSSAVKEASALSSEVPPVASGFSKKVFTDRQMLVFEIIILCTIAFSSSILLSAFSLFDPSIFVNSSRNEYAWTMQVLREVSGLALLWYLLMRRGKNFSSIGLNWRWKDLGWSIILVFSGLFAYKFIYSVLFVTGITSVSSSTTGDNVGRILFGGGFFLSTFLLQLVNPFFEELIVRAYLMTEVKFLTNSMAKAVIISTVLQTSYHFYQGVPAALSHAATFLIFSIFYAKTNRIAPIILAHLYMDVGATTWYWLQYHLL